MNVDLRHKQSRILLSKLFNNFKWDWTDDGDVVRFKSPRWRSFYTGVVSSSLDEDGTFVITKSVLENAKANRVFHVNVDTQYVVWYDVKQALDLLGPTEEFKAFKASSHPKIFTKRKVENA